MNIFQNKKGVLLAAWGTIIFIFTFIVFLSLVSVIWYHVNVEVQALDETIADNLTKERITDMGGIFSFLDRAVPFFFVLSWIVTLLFSLKVVPDHPFFFVLSFIVLIILTLISVFLTDFFTIFFAESVFSVIIDNISNSLFFANKFHYISFGVMAISLIIFYSRNKASKEVGVV